MFDAVIWVPCMTIALNGPGKRYTVSGVQPKSGVLQIEFRSNAQAYDAFRDMLRQKDSVRTISSGRNLECLKTMRTRTVLRRESIGPGTVERFNVALSYWTGRKNVKKVVVEGRNA